MAVASWSSSAMMKAVLLPLVLVLLAVAAGASSAEGEGAVAKSGGRFSETPVGRKLLGSGHGLCGEGSAPNYNCAQLLKGATNATCCPDLLGTLACWDVGAFWLDKCGSCTTSCKFGEVCCNGVCANLLTDKNNCGICKHKCGSPQVCKFGFCGY